MKERVGSVIYLTFLKKKIFPVMFFLLIALSASAESLVSNKTKEMLKS